MCSMFLNPMIRHVVGWTRISNIYLPIMSSTLLKVHSCMPTSAMITNKERSVVLSLLVDSLTSLQKQGRIEVLKKGDVLVTFSEYLQILCNRNFDQFLSPHNMQRSMTFQSYALCCMTNFASTRVGFLNSFELRASIKAYIYQLEIKQLILCSSVGLVSLKMVK